MINFRLHGESINTDIELILERHADGTVDIVYRSGSVTQLIAMLRPNGTIKKYRLVEASAKALGIQIDHEYRIKEVE